MVEQPCVQQASPTAAELRSHGGLVRYLRHVADRSGLSFPIVRRRWYQGARGQALEAPKTRRTYARRPDGPPDLSLPKVDMYVRTWFGSFNVSRPQGVLPWPAFLARRALEGCRTAGPSPRGDREPLGESDLEPPGWD